MNAILFSPAFRKDASGSRDTSHCLLDPAELADWIIADNLPARLGLQIHKFIWDPAVKGVIEALWSNRNQIHSPAAIRGRAA